MKLSFGKGAQTQGQVKNFMFQDQSENESNLKRRKMEPMKENIFDFSHFIAHFMHAAQAHTSFSIFL